MQRVTTVDFGKFIERKLYFQSSKKSDAMQLWGRKDPEQIWGPSHVASRPSISVDPIPNSCERASGLTQA